MQGQVDAKMAKKLYIHIGPPKTGTSAIQKMLDSNDHLLAEKGVHYIKTLRCKLGSHNLLAYILHYTYDNVHLFMNHRSYIVEKDAFFKKLNEEIAGISAPIVLVSSENFVYLSPEAIDELIRLFTSNFSKIKVKVIFYVRSFNDLALSEARFIVQLKHSNTNDERLCNLANTLSSIERALLSGLDIFVSRFGKENVIFRKYGKQYFKHGNIFEDFLDAIGVELNDSFVLPQELVNASLTCCETVYVKDMLNRMVMNTPEDLIVKHLMEWEQYNANTRFSLAPDIAARVEELSEHFHRHLLDNYLDDTYNAFLQKYSLNQSQYDYKLSYDTFIGIIDYLSSKIENFKSDIMDSIITSLDKAYEFDLNTNMIKERFENIVRSRKTVALWGCGDIAERILKKFEFDFLGTSVYLVDKNKDKQGNYFMGHRIFPPSLISEKDIDTVMTASARYGDEIAKEIKEKYPCVRYIVKLDGLSTVLEEKDIMKDCWL